MKRIILSICITILITRVFSQNLIPNGDFELGPDSSSGGWSIGVWDTTCSPTTIVYGPDFWFVVDATPDRMVEGDIPTCNWDNDTAQSGKAYIDFASGGTGNPNYTESAKAILINPLEKDSLYHLRYCLNRQTFNGLLSSPALIAFIFENDTIVSPLISSTQWECYDTIFIASTSCSEIKIQAIKFGLPTGANVDNLFLEKITSSKIYNFFDLDNTISMFPNPTNRFVSIISKKYIISDIQIFNITGALNISEVKHISSNQINIDFSEFKEGIYAINIYLTNRKYITKKIIVFK